jgi:hypothetical protein
VKGLVVFVAALVALLLAATWGHGGDGQACPAIGWSSSVRVELTGDWSARPVGVVELECSTPCERLTVLDEVTGEPVELHTGSDPLSWPVFGELPSSAVATVLAPDGSELARVESQLDWERVGGTEECGGPAEAIVRVPAP